MTEAIAEAPYLLNVIWFGLLGVLLAGYAVLDGFDLGVGMLHPTARSDNERRIFLNSIGPLWDGNEVWLVTFGGALFAAFPLAYASVFSTFYIPFMLLLCALIFRAVSIEFRSKRDWKVWRGFWDYSFSVSSGLAALLFGVAVGNAMQGLPIDADGNFQGNFWDFLHPYSIMVGLLAMSMCAMHGAIFLHMKTEGKLQERIYHQCWTSFGIFMVLYILTTMYTLVNVPGAVDNFQRLPIAWLVVILNVLAIANIPRNLYRHRAGWAFISSAGTIIAFVFLFGIAIYPHLFTSSLDPEYSITVYNGASSQKTLGIMLLIAAIGMPMVLAYTVIIYWTFRGKVELGKFSY
jgi:cytochrome d ubiquinol oxidase subunit II